MSEDTGPLDDVVTAVTLPFRLVGRGLGYLVAVALLALVPVVTVTAFSLAWFPPFLLVEVAVGLPVVVTLGLADAVGLPSLVAGVPALYPFVMGVLTSLVLGWPNPDYESDIDSGLFGRIG